MSKTPGGNIMLITKVSVPYKTAETIRRLFEEDTGILLHMEKKLNQIVMKGECSVNVVETSEERILKGLIEKRGTKKCCKRILCRKARYTRAMEMYGNAIDYAMFIWREEDGTTLSNMYYNGKWQYDEHRWIFNRNPA